MSSLVEFLRAGVMTGSAEGTREVAAELAGVLPPDVALALHGDLGVGKTTFVQGLAAGFGIEQPVTSPTFTLCRFYRSARPAGRTLAHLDAYRLEDAAQVETLLLEDFLISPYCLAVEWPDRIAAWMPRDTWHFELGIMPDARHTIQLRG